MYQFGKLRLLSLLKTKVDPVRRGQGIPTSYLPKLNKVIIFIHIALRRKSRGGGAKGARN